MNIDQAIPVFAAESRELLAQMESALLEIEAEGASPERVNALFWAAHTIKGSAGLFGFDDVVGFTHVLESVLDRVREGAMAMAAPLPELMLSGHDHICALLKAVLDGIPLEGPVRDSGEVLTGRLKAYLEDSPAALSQVNAQAHACPDTTAAATCEAQVASGNLWHISLRFGPDVLRNGMDPLAFLRYLQTLGEIMHISTLYQGMPAVAEMDPETCYLGFEIGFDSAADKHAIESTFDFVREDCRLRILPPRSRITEYIRLIRELPEEELKLGEILVRCGTLTRNELDEALREQSAEPVESARPVGEILVDRGSVERPVLDSAVEKQRQVRETRNTESRFIRVEAGKLEQLIDLVGELVITGAGVAQKARRHADGDLLETTSSLTRLVEQVRDGALKLRMVPIAESFNRFHRVVRDVSKELGKDIQLTIMGAETELDKTVVEHIGDPLTHLVRNAIDHGIEAAPVRLAAGKPATGTVRLSAHHDSGTIVIEVSDDGGGLDPERLRAKAVQRGLIDADQTLSDKEAQSLIFEPGFSTADAVTNLSGRGVGMDVVKRNITALRGAVEIDSQIGVGTTIRIRLPLTLAIIDGFLVSVGSIFYVIPLDTVVECIELPAQDDTQPHACMELRGRLLPYIRLSTMLLQDAANRANVRRESIVVVQAGSVRAGLVVDTLHGEVQTVIKPLGPLFCGLRGISGSSVLGSGDVALILDVAQLLDMTRRESKPAWRDSSTALAA